MLSTTIGSIPYHMATMATQYSTTFQIPIPIFQQKWLSHFLLWKSNIKTIWGWGNVKMTMTTRVEIETPNNTMRMRLRWIYFFVNQRQSWWWYRRMRTVYLHTSCIR
jgi:hypothetical protein